MAEPQKKMTLVQLTFIVAVNMMGSGIIMLPTNMAKVGAISLLSWIVTAVGSMAIAYSFAQAGIFNQRPGGMAAYAEDAYQKPGYFQTFFLYFVSLAIGNVAIAISAVGYLATFFPGMSATPIATCLSVIFLIWLTTVANFGGPGITGKIGSVTVWGVIIPVGALSIIGWFWFKSSTFAAAWNPNGLSLGEGMGSSIALTLWAFLGMESAAQNSSAVENPKRDVPLACLYGTLGAAVIYVLSTTVIQGIVPNAELADSTGPFGLAYAKMFNPTIGSIIMGLAVMACLGSLLGWQFTIASTAKSAAEERMFPGFFRKENKMGAPVVGMLIMAVVQTAMALMTISPNLSEQFGVLVNLAVVTNLVPYIIALSALPLIMQTAGVDPKKYRLNVAVALVALTYSIYSIYASGKDAVFGGMIVMGIAYVIWGFIAKRFKSGNAPPQAGAARVAVPAMIVITCGMAFAGAAPAAGQTLQRIRDNGSIRLGYRTDARPLSYQNESGGATGYSVALCQEIVEAAKAEVSRPDLSAVWVPVTAESRYRALAAGEIDLLCGAETETLSRRGQASFSIPIFPGGIGAVVRRDAADRFKDVLSGRQPAFRPNWRATAGQVLLAKKFAVMGATTAEQWLEDKRREFDLVSEVVRVDSYEAGVQSVLDGKADAFFGDRVLLLDAGKRSSSPGGLTVLDRMFTVEPVALAMTRGDDDFRLFVDRTLSKLVSSGKAATAYEESLGKPDEAALTFLRTSALPD